MRILEFPEQTIVIAKNQPPYLPLPAHRTKDGEVTSCWGLGLRERVKLLFTGKIYFTLLTFNQKIQPQRASIIFNGTDR